MKDRFVWNIGAIKEQFPDMPEQVDGSLVLWDRQEQKAVATVAPEYAQAICLETTSTEAPAGELPPFNAPFTNLERWLNGLTNAEMESEGLPITK